LQIANSAFFGAGRTFKAIEAAVSYLGFATIKGLVLSAEVFRPERVVAGQSIEELQQHSLHVARLAAPFAHRTRVHADPFPAGLLDDIGVLVLASRGLRRGAGSDSGAPAAARSATQRFDALVGEPNASHGEVGAYLLGLWGFPYPVVEAVAHHHA